MPGDLSATHWIEKGEFLKREIVRKGFTVSTLAEKLGVTRQAIYNIMGERPISPNWAKTLSETLGGTVDFWLSDRFPDYSDSRQAAVGLGPEAYQGVLVDWQIKKLNGQDFEGDELGFYVGGLRDDLIKSSNVDIEAGYFFEKGEVFLEHYKTGKVGEIYALCDHADDNPRLLNGDGLRPTRELDLAEGASVFAMSKGRVHFGPRFKGRVAQITLRNLEGLNVSCGSEIDPGFRGYLAFRVTNNTGGLYRLKYGLPIATVEIMALVERPEQPYLGNPGSAVWPVLQRVRNAFRGQIGDAQAGERKLEFKDSAGALHIISGASDEDVLRDLFGRTRSESGRTAILPPEMSVMVGDTFVSIQFDDKDVATLGEFFGIGEEEVERVLQNTLDRSLYDILNAFARRDVAAMPRFAGMLLGELAIDVSEN